MALSEDPPDTKRYMEYRKDPRSIIRTIDAYLTGLSGTTHDLVKVQVNGPTATGFLILTPTDVNASPATMDVTLTYAHETIETFECVNTLPPSDIGRVLSVLNSYLGQYWDRFDAFCIEITTMDSNDLRAPLHPD